MKTDFKPLPVQDEKDVAATMKRHGIPNIGRAIKAANEDGDPRPHQLKCKLSTPSYDALQRFIFEKKIAGERGLTADCLIARGLQALGIEIDPSDLMPDRRKK